MEAHLRPSWMGTSSLCPEDLERELAALRAMPVSQKGVQNLPAAASTKGKSNPRPRQRRSPFLPLTKWAPTSSANASYGWLFSCQGGRPTTDQALQALQEEVDVLQVALLPDNEGNVDDYRRAQRSMDRFEYLESVLWEVHSYEAAEAMVAETRDAQQAHTAERTTLESTLRQRGCRLAEACTRQVHALCQEHEKQVAELDQPALTNDGEDEKVSRPTPAAVERHPSAEVEETESRVVDHLSTTAVASSNFSPNRRPTGRERHHEREVKTFGEARESDSRVSYPEQPSPSREVVPATGLALAVPTTARVAVVPAVKRAAAATGMAGVVTADRWRHGKELVELKDELSRHLTAVEHVLDGSRHLGEATRVMREIEKLQARERLDAETRSRGVLCISTEKAALLQKQAQAQKVQRDKHDRLRRALESSGAEELRLLSARQNGATTRLAARCRDENRRRKMELRGKLAVLKGAVAREWRAHNTRSRGFCTRSGGGDKSSKDGLPSWRSAHAQAGAGRKTQVASVGGEISCCGQRRDAAARVGKYDDCHAVVREGVPVPRAEAESRKGGGTGTQSKRAARGTPSDGVQCPPLPQERDLDVREGGTSCETPLRPPIANPATNTKTADEESQTLFARRSDDGRNPKDGARAEPATSNSLPTPLANSPTSASVKNFMISGSRRGPLQRRRKHVAATVTLADSTTKGANPQRAANSFTSGGTSEDANCRTLSVLSEEEVLALATLGRGAPTDPRLLLLATPPAPPPPMCRREQQHENDESSVEMDSCSGDGGDGGDGGDVSGTQPVSREFGGGLQKVLERAADKLARNIQAEEEWSRRRLGMASGWLTF